MKRICVVIAGAILIAGQIGSQEPPFHQARLQHRIGSESELSAVLTFIPSIQVSRNGAVYIAQPMDQIIRVFDQSGKLIRTIGRNGAGPGEFRFPITIGFKNDSLWALDPQQRRITVFRPNGKFARSIVLTDTDYGLLMADGSIVGTERTGPESPVRLLHWLHGGATPTEIARIDPHTQPMHVAVGNGGATGSQPFEDSPLWHVSTARGIVFVVDRPAAMSNSDAFFRVTAIRASGDTIYSRDYPYEPIALSSADVDAAVAAKISALQRRVPPGFSVSRDAIRSAMYRPKFRPPVTALQPATDGSLWLRREPGRNSQSIWLVLDPEGRPIMRVTLPTALDIRFIEGRAVWGFFQTPDDASFALGYGVE